MASSANALYVLRLVAQRSRGSVSLTSTARFSSAALRSAEPSSPLCSAASSSTTTTTAAAAASATEADFLETDEQEYTSASSFLPARAAVGAHPIPWPTLFSDHTPGTSRAPAARPCDLVARLVAEGRLEPARKVYAELRALDTIIAPRKLYLDAALAALASNEASTEQARADFLFWLALYPNRPALKSTPTLKTTWTPIVNRILDSHAQIGFMTDFLVLAGTKGLLPTVLPLLTPPLVAMTSPNVSERTLEAAIAAYVASTVSSTSTSARAQQFRKVVDHQVSVWWNSYLRRLALSGWDDAARALLYSPPESVSWTRITRGVVLGQGLDRKAASLAARQEQEAAERENPLMVLRKPEVLPLPARVRAVASAAGAASDRLPTVVELAAIQDKLEQLHRTTLLARLARRYARRTPTRSLPTVAHSWWIHAEILRLVDAERNEDALALFRKHYLWIGLPRRSPTTAGPGPAGTSAENPALVSSASTSGSAAAQPENLTPRLLPTIQVLTTLLPAVLALESHPLGYLDKYLSSLRSLPPVLQPTSYTHLAFVRSLARQAGPSRATEGISALLASGANPTLPTWNVLLVSLLSHGEFDAALRLLSSLETGATPSGASAPMPLPSGRTYVGLIHVAARSGHAAQAAMFLKRFRKFINVNAARGREISDEEKELLTLAKTAMRVSARKRAQDAAEADGVAAQDHVGGNEEKLVGRG